MHLLQTQRKVVLMRDKLGVCQWFHYQDYRSLEQAVQLMRELDVRLLRTGISWADFYRPGGRKWYDDQMAALAEFDVLLSIWHTPPSISQGNSCNSPPTRLRDYANFIDLIITEYGGLFSHLELWNEPNNRYKWDFPRFDPQWKQFAQMIADAAHWARQRQVPTVLGGMIPVDHHWLDLMRRHGMLQHIDIVAIHAFPGMWWPEKPNWDWHAHWNGWDAKLAYIAEHADNRPIWVTETGLATWDLSLHRPAKHKLQIQALDAAAAAPADRIYWYSLIDLDPEREAIEGFHVDENEYHMGLVTFDGRRKDAFHRFKELMTSQAPPPELADDADLAST
jgi:CDP-paratose 2-epimerase